MIEYVIISSLLLLSGSIWGWVNPILFLVNLSAVILLLSLKKFYNDINVSRENLSVLGIIVFSHVVNMALVSHINPLSAWNVFTVIFCAYTVGELISKESFINKYVNIISLLAALSLVFWFLSKFGIVIGDQIVEPGNGKIYKMNLFYIYRDSKGVIEPGLNTRNFGIFWEGGAYQAFLNLAILFLVRFKKGLFKKDNLYWVKLCILIITVITTFSTIGYFLLIINMLFFLLNNTKAESRTRYLVTALFLGIGIIVITSPAVINKFNSASDSYISYVIRLNDQLNGIKAAFVSPLWGLGFNSHRYTSVLNSYGIYANSSGLLIVVQQFGFIYAAWFTFTQFIRFLNFCSITKHIEQLLGIVFLGMIFAAESLNQNGIFLLFLFVFNNQKSSFPPNSHWDQKKHSSISI